MPFEIVRNDIAKMQADAIVNTANPKPTIGSGTDSAIHYYAGPKLIKARQAIGDIAVGDAAITPGYKLKAKYVIHAVGPVWQGGGKQEEALLARCYQTSLELAAKKHCKSIAFPLISAGNYGFPKALALQIAVDTIRAFLEDHEMQVSLVIFNRDVYRISEALFYPVKSYIDEHYVNSAFAREYGSAGVGRRRESQQESFDNASMPLPMAMEQARPTSAAAPKKEKHSFLNLESLLRKTDAGFSETVLKLIDQSGKKDSEVYKKANIDRKLFSKIRSNPRYQPSKSTALALAIALELDLDQTRDLIGRAGFALSRSSKFDIIIEYFIETGNYNIDEINLTLFEFDQSLLGAG